MCVSQLDKLRLKLVNFRHKDTVDVMESPPPPPPPVVLYLSVPVEMSLYKMMDDHSSINDRHRVVHYLICDSPCQKNRYRELIL